MAKSKYRSEEEWKEIIEDINKARKGGVGVLQACHSRDVETSQYYRYLNRFKKASKRTAKKPGKMLTVQIPVGPTKADLIRLFESMLQTLAGAT
jgi:hypothetical protein